MDEYKPYTGIGSRETPEQVQLSMEIIGRSLALKGYTLRSGGADGADMSFEGGCDMVNGQKEIYLPWRNFNNRQSIYETAQYEAYEIAEIYHPRWKYLKQGAKKLHARNVHQVLGPDVTHPVYSEFIVCWTKDGKRGGGTGQALRIAESHNIKIYDLSIADDAARLVLEVLDA